MADIVQTAANVRAVTGSEQTGTAGEAISAGDTVYKKVSDGLYYRGDSNVSSAEAVLAGIATTGAGAGQPFTFLGRADDVVNPGGTVVVGEVYVQSDNVGKI